MKPVGWKSYVLALLIFTSWFAPAAAAQPAAPARVVIADQFGPGHLVTVVMKKRRLLESRFPGTELEWRVVTSGAVMRDGILSDNIHIGLTAPPPFLVGVDKGVKWKIVAGAATYDQWLVAGSNIATLKDFVTGERKQIAVVGTDSFPAIVLKKAAQKQLGDVKALDSHLVIMPPPQAVQAVVSGQLAGALIPPVHSVRAVDLGAKVVLRANDVFSGPVTNNFYVASDAFYARYPAFFQGFYEAVEEAVRFIGENPGEAYRMLSEDEGNKTAPEKYRDLFERSGTTFGTVPRRVLEVGRFMKEIGMIKQLPGTLRELSFPPLGGQGD